MITIIITEVKVFWETNHSCLILNSTLCGETSLKKYIKKCLSSRQCVCPQVRNFHGT
jgi:hypothetical protein